MNKLKNHQQGGTKKGQKYRKDKWRNQKKRNSCRQKKESAEPTFQFIEKNYANLGNKKKLS